MRFVFVLFFALCAALPAAAQIKGQEDQAFQNALSTWLTGDDLAALTAMSDLAADDNRAAQLFLGILAPAAWTHAHVTEDMSRADRNALLKAPGGLSGKNWLTIAAEDTPLAATYMAAKEPSAGEDVAHALFDAGDLAQGYLTIARSLNFGRFDEAFGPALRPDALPITMGMFDVFDAEIELSPNTAEIRAALAKLPEVTAAQRAMWPLQADTTWTDRDANAEQLHQRGLDLADHVLVVPVATLLNDKCGPDGPTELAVLQGIYQNYPVPILAQSPIEALLPTATYQDSPRFAADFARRVTYSGPPADFIAKYLPCIADFE